MIIYPFQYSGRCACGLLDLGIFPNDPKSPRSLVLGPHRLSALHVMLHQSLQNFKVPSPNTSLAVIRSVTTR